MGLTWRKLVLCSLLFFISIPKINSSDCGLKNNVFKKGETLTYKIFYTWAGAYVGAGEATFKNEFMLLDNKPCYHISCEGHSYKSYDWFFKVRDLYESYVDTATLLPIQFKRKVEEGSNKLFNSVIFNHELHRATSTEGVYTIPDCVQDVLSGIYYARNLDFTNDKLNQKHHFQLFLDDKLENVYVEYLGKCTLKTKFGTYKTVKFKTKLIAGTIFKGGDEMLVYATDDKNKIPVYIETPIVVGKIKAFLLK